MRLMSSIFRTFQPEKKKKRSHKSGEGSHRSKSRRDGAQEGNESAEESDVEQVDGDETAWVSARRAEDLMGPMLLYQSFSSSSSSTSSELRYLTPAVNANTSKVQLEDLAPGRESRGSHAHAHALDPELEGATIVDDLPPDLSQAASDPDVRPATVQQVFVASRVLDTAQPPRYTFRTSEQRFLGADKHGTVLCVAEARGPQEEWAVETIRESTGAENSDGGDQGSGKVLGIALRNHVHGTYLSMDEVAGGKMVLRADAQSVSMPSAASGQASGEIWSARVQWKYRHQARQAEREREIGKAGILGAGKRLKLDQGVTDEYALK